MDFMLSEGRKPSMPELKSPEDLFHWMQSHLEYGWVGRDRKKRVGRLNTEKDKSDFFLNYALQSPCALHLSRVGVCWDQVEYERYFFRKMGIQFKTIFMVQPNSASHTFLYYQGEKGFYIFENSYERYAGIFGPFENEKEIIEAVGDHLNLDSGERSFEWKYYDKPHFDIGCKDFYEFVGFGKYMNE